MSTPGLTQEQADYLAAQQAAQASASSASVVNDAATVADQITSTERGPLLPAEAGIDDLMAQIKAQSEALAAMQSQIGVLQKQQEEANAASGGPLTVRYAQGAADKIAAATAQWPAHDLSVAAAAAGDVLDAANAAVKGDGSVGPKLQVAQSAITRVFSKLPHIDSSAILDDLGAAVEEALKLHAA